MITLRNLVRSDTSIASITGDECRFIATVLEWAFVISQSWTGKVIMSKSLRDKALSMRMLAATLGRTPEERTPSFREQIRIAMQSGEDK